MIHKANSDKSSQPGPILETIRDQHRHIVELFERYLATPADSRRAIVDEILQRLTSHLQSEESQFYTALRQTGPRGEGLVEAALSEHEEIIAMIEEIQNSETVQGTASVTDRMTVVETGSRAALTPPLR